jgi:monoterpene epsilon-lactone hydrolase
MQSATRPSLEETFWSAVHPIAPADAAFMAGLRPMVEPNKGRLQGIAARPPFDAIMGHVPPAAGVTYRADTVGGISGWWCLPADAEQGSAILHLHGGWFNWGTAAAYRNLVGHIAARAQTAAFVPDYRLAPENPFPAGLRDVEACYRGLFALGFRPIALSGDSAGGNLALVLLSLLASRPSSGGTVPAAAVVLSPVTDLTLRGSSIETRAAADPYFTRPQVEGLVRAYLGDADPRDPLASPLFGDLRGLPPVRVHVGDVEILLEDSRRYVARAVEAGVDAKLDVWLGMPHGFVGSVGSLSAADQSLDAAGTFLRERLRTALLTVAPAGLSSNRVGDIFYQRA